MLHEMIRLTSGAAGRLSPAPPAREYAVGRARRLQRILLSPVCCSQLPGTTSSKFIHRLSHYAMIFFNRPQLSTHTHTHTHSLQRVVQTYLANYSVRRSSLATVPSARPLRLPQHAKSQVRSAHVVLTGRRLVFCDFGALMRGGRTKQREKRCRRNCQQLEKDSSGKGRCRHAKCFSLDGSPSYSPVTPTSLQWLYACASRFRISWPRARRAGWRMAHVIVVMT